MNYLQYVSMLLAITFISASLNFQNISKREKCMLCFPAVFLLHARLTVYDAPASPWEREKSLLNLHLDEIFALLEKLRCLVF
jgi:hypothetical protein